MESDFFCDAGFNYYIQLEANGNQCSPYTLLILKVQNQICPNPFTHQNNQTHSRSQNSCLECYDGIQNNDETGIDCGGENCVACACDVSIASSTLQLNSQNSGFDFSGNLISTTTSSEYVLAAYIGDELVASSQNYYKDGDMVYLGNIPCNENVIIRALQVDAPECYTELQLTTSSCQASGAPNTQASNMRIAHISFNQFYGTWDRGNGQKILVTCTPCGLSETTPNYGVEYGANSDYSQAPTIGDSRLVYLGTSDSRLITGLSDNTCYRLRAYEYNGSNFTSQYLLSNPATESATTLDINCIPPPIFSLSYSNITSNGVTVNWASVGEASSYDIGIKPVNNANFTYYNTTTTPYNISNLMAATDYSVIIRSNGCIEGPWSPYSSFTTLSATQSNCTNTVNSFAYHNDFENSLEFTQLTSDDTDWTLTDSETPSGSTGPTGTPIGDSYIFVESSTPYSPNKQAILESQCFNLTGLSEPGILFLYHMFGEDMGSLKIQVSRSTVNNWHTVEEITGNQGDTWHIMTIPLENYYNETVKFRIVGTTGNGWRSDIALDYFSVYDLCRYNVVQNAFSHGTFYLKAETTIESAGSMQSGHLDLDAGTSITLKPGFSVPLGSTMHAYINGCNNINNLRPEDFPDLAVEEESTVNSLIVYPNPTNQTINVEYNLNSSQDVKLYLMDFSGRMVQEINNGQQEQGQHSQKVIFGDRLSHGLYNVVLRTEEGTYSKKIVYQKE